MDSPIYIAFGETFPHRFILSSFGWEWNETLNAWVKYNCKDEYSDCIQVVRSLPGVYVRFNKIKN